jgi:glycolate dehydrogenase iron-sulfur subunit
MKTDLHSSFIDTQQGREAQSILLSCVHCGFCTATCPTYQLLGDERDGPRGRIYLIKQLLETGSATERTRTHLDRCLSCRSCETTCPSGVEYGRLLDIGRDIVETQTARTAPEQLMRRVMLAVLPYRYRFTPLLRLGQFFRRVLPSRLRQLVPEKQQALPWPSASHSRVVIALAGCAQPGATPNTNAAAARVLDRLGITLQEAAAAGCCGAMSYHLSEQAQGLDFARRNIDAWWPALEQGAEAIVVSASGCGTMVKDYGHLLAGDVVYAEKAARVSELALDLSELVAAQDLSSLKLAASDKRTAVHCPCSLQHGQQLPDSVQRILSDQGFHLVATQDGHLCCGSAGTYSLLQPELSEKLLNNKIEALTIDAPEQIVTANVGCQMHLASRAQVPVKHWIEILDEACQPGIAD